MTLELVTPAIDRVVSLTEVKQFCNIDTSAYDDKLLVLIDAAESYLSGRDGITGRVFRPSQWRYDIPGFTDCIRLPLPPTISIEAIRYYDTNDTLQLLATSYYRVIAGGFTGNLIIPAESSTYPSTNIRPDAVQVTFTAGYQDLESPENEAVMGTVKMAVFMLVKSWYDNPGEPVPDVVLSLIAPIRLTYL